MMGGGTRRLGGILLTGLASLPLAFSATLDFGPLTDSIATLSRMAGAMIEGLTTLAPTELRLLLQAFIFFLIFAAVYRLPKNVDAKVRLIAGLMLAVVGTTLTTLTLVTSIGIVGILIGIVAILSLISFSFRKDPQSPTAIDPVREGFGIIVILLALWVAYAAPATAETMAAAFAVDLAEFVEMTLQIQMMVVAILALWRIFAAFTTGDGTLLGRMWDGLTGWRESRKNKKAGTGAGGTGGAGGGGAPPPGGTTPPPGGAGGGGAPPPPTPPPLPPLTEVQNISFGLDPASGPHALRVTWDANDAAQRVRDYRLMWYQPGLSTGWEDTGWDPALERTFDLHDTTAQVHIQVQARNVAGDEGPWGSAHGPPGGAPPPHPPPPPPPPLPLPTRVQNISFGLDPASGPNALHVEWDANDAAQRVTGYRVQWNQPSAGTGWVDEGWDPALERTFDLHDPTAEVHLAVSAQNATGEGPSGTASGYPGGAPPPGGGGPTPGGGGPSFASELSRAESHLNDARTMLNGIFTDLQDLGVWNGATPRRFTPQSYVHVVGIATDPDWQRIERIRMTIQDFRSRMRSARTELQSIVAAGGCAPGSAEETQFNTLQGQFSTALTDYRDVLRGARHIIV